MIITLTGNNSYVLRRRLDEIVNKFIDEHGVLALERIEAEKLDSQAIIEAVQSLPFLAGRKMVVIRDLSVNKQAAESIEQILSSTGETTELIIYEPQIDKRTSYYKVLKSKTQLEEFNELEPRALVDWLVREAQSLGGRLDVKAANYLIERVGDSQQMLFTDLLKLVIYNPDISLENIDLLTEPAPQGKIFELLDAVFLGHKQRALMLYDEQRLQRIEPQEILAMITWQLRLLALTKYSKDRSVSDIAKDSGLNPYPVTKAKNLAAKIAGGKLNKMVDEALDIDWRAKTTAIDMDEALRTYIITL